jgi:serine/threonine protein kinase
MAVDVAIGAPDEEPEPGPRIAGYRIERRIGSGGMSHVYLARDERLGRQVALKVMLSRHADRDFRVRFIRESRAAAAVDHPNIIPVYEAGESGGELFIAMRYVRDGDAGTLAQRQGQLSPELVMSIITPVAEALDAAHEAGLVHRDVKPANMLLDQLTDRTHVYLTDFGITIFTQDVNITDAGAVIGTPAFMAPEQFNALPVTGQTDQWGLACSAFALLSGRPPFAGWPLPKLFYEVVNGAAPSITSIRPELPATADSVFARALAKDPGDRYASCGDFADALGAALGLASVAMTWRRPSASSSPPRAASRQAEPAADASGVKASEEPADWSPPPGAGPSAGSPSGEGQSGEAPPDARDAGSYEYQFLPASPLDVPLRQSFRYVHEPSRADDDALPSLGNDDLIAKLEKRLRHSRGGTFLITGFRGVGKSTLVMRALDELSARSGPSDIVVPVSLSVARSTTTERLLFAVVRRIFETLHDERVLDRLPAQTRHALLVSYMRTSLSYKETQSKSNQQSAGLNVGLGPGKLVEAVASIAAPQVSLSASRSQSLATEAAFLAYSETDVEYDLMRIISLVNRTLDVPPGRLSLLGRLRPRWLQRHGLVAPPRLRLVIVLDEVDKLTVDDKGMAAVEELLSGTKNVLTMSGAHFLVVAGPDLQDRAARDASRGTGVYESVFGWRLYVPCVWDAPDRLVEDMVIDSARDDKDKIDMLVHYLRFKARGVPRRLLQEVNSFVSWDDDRPRLQIGARDLDRIEFFAGIEEILRAFTDGTDRGSFFTAAIDTDRLRLGSYFVVDWILASKGTPFTATELLYEGEDAKFDPLLHLDKTSVDRLLDHLADHGILEIVRGGDAMNTVLPDVKVEKSYCLSDGIRRILRRMPDRTVTRVTPTASRGAGASGQPRVIGGRYEVGDLIGQGSLSSVYKGRDVVTGGQVTIRLLPSALNADPVALARFRREAEITRNLDHEQVVQTYAVLDGPNDYAIITERLLGQTLQQQVRDEGAMQPGEVVGMGQVLADALTYLAGKQVVRLDLKPANIVMADRGPVIADLGIALHEAAAATMITATGPHLIGTPAFMAPELIRGDPADSRSDLYSLGLVLYYCLARRLPWEDLPNIMGIINAVLFEDLDMSGLGVSSALRAALERATARNIAERFPDAASFGAALRETPEWLEYQTGPKPAREVTRRDFFPTLRPGDLSWDDEL